MELTFAAELFPWAANGSWVFAAVPMDDADAIEDATSLTGGFGSIKVEVQIGDTVWLTSLFPSKEMQTYVLPIKKAVRSAEGVEQGDTAEITIRLVHV